MILSALDLLEKIMPLFADRTDDESLALLEDVTDTLNALSSVITEEEMNAKVAEVAEEWRKRYHDRFFDGEEKQEVKEEVKEEKNEEGEKKKEEEITLEDVVKGDDE